MANNNSHDVSVLSGNGDGSFGEAVHYAGGGLNPYQVIAEDFTGDGHLDLVLANHNSSSVELLAGMGDGVSRRREAGPGTVAVRSRLYR